MSNDEINIFEKVWKMIMELFYKIIASIKGDDGEVKYPGIKDPYATTAND